MFQWFIDAFRHPSAEELRQRQLHEAQAALVQCEASAEYYAFQTAMYKARVLRLQGGNVAKLSAIAK